MIKMKIINNKRKNDPNIKTKVNHKLEMSFVLANGQMIVVKGDFIVNISPTNT
jgi:RNA-binding protein YhbY